MHENIQLGSKVFIDAIPYAVEGKMEGGMGVVYIMRRLSNEVMDRRIYRIKIAVKTFKDDEFHNSEKNFISRELNSWILLDHVCIVPLLKVGNLETRICSIMPVYQGNLRTLFNETSLSEDDIIHLGIQISKGLMYAAKQHNILHLDIKPDNILLSDIDNNSRRYLISDWGIASIQRKYSKQYSDKFDIEETYRNFGTLPYMSPERFLVEDNNGQWVDIFSVGMVMLEAFFKELPFRFEDDIYTQIINCEYYETTLKMISCVRNKKLQYVLAKCLHPNYEHRYSCYSELIVDLDQCFGLVRRIAKIIF